MATSFPAYIVHSQRDPLVHAFIVDAAATFVTGELVFIDTAASNVLKGCGADPTAILGIALAPASSKTLYPGSRVPVAVLDPDVVVAMSSSTTPVEATHLTVLYGVEKTGTNWRVDTTDTTNTRVTPIRLDVTNGIWYCKFLAASLQGDSIVS